MTTRWFRPLLGLLVMISLLLPSRAMAEDAKPVDPKGKPKVNYTDHIQPIFREHCYSCHSRDTAKSDLALDTYGGVMRGGAGGEVIWAGEPDSSRLWSLVAHMEAPKMPPEQDKLAEAKLSLIKQWILDGALETAGSKAKAKPKNNLELKVASGSGRPAGPPPMPENISRDPVVYTAKPGAVTALAASPWAPLVAVGGQKQVLLYHADTAELLGVLPFPEGAVHVLKFSRSGTVLLAGGGRGGQSGRVVLFDVKTGARLAEIGDELDAVIAADVNDDHTLVALGTPRRIVRIYSVADGSQQAEIRKHTDWVYSVEFSPDGVLLATSDRSAGLFVWESDTGREFQNLSGHTAGITDVSWRIDSNVLASASEDGTIKLWEMENGRQIKSWSAHARGVTALEYARDGKIVSTGRDRTTRLWDGNGKQLLALEALGDEALEVAITHDGKRIVAGDWLGEIRVWNVADGKRAGQLAENPPTLAMFVQTEPERIQSLEATAAKLAGEVAAAGKAAAAQAASAQAATAAVAHAAAETKRLEEARVAAEKSMPQKIEALKTARDKMSGFSKALDKARQEEGSARRQVMRGIQNLKSLADRRAGLERDQKRLADELTAFQAALDAKQQQKKKLEEAKDPKPVASQLKALNNELATVHGRIRSLKSQADSAVRKLQELGEQAKKQQAEQAEGEKLLATKAAALKSADEQVAAAKKAIEQLEADRAATQKSIPAAAAAVKALAGQANARKTAVENAAKAKAAADATLAAKQAELKAAHESLARAKANLEKAKHDLLAKQAATKSAAN